jgi:hypothetical protein
LHLSADRGGDGIVDAEMPPTIVFDGHTPREPVARFPAFATAATETSQSGGERISFTIRSDAPESAAGVLFAVLPGQPDWSRYEQPFDVSEGSLVLFRENFSDGSLGPLQERRSFEEIDAAVEVRAAVDGFCVAVTIPKPGRLGTVTFDAVEGQRLRIEVTDVQLGGSACCGAVLWLGDPDGEPISDHYSLGSSGAVLELPSLRATGTYGLTIDPAGSITGSLVLSVRST